MDPGKAIYFIVDEPNADLILASDMLQAVEPNLERDLNLSPRIRDLVRSELFGTLLFGALTGTVWRCGWRYAGGIVGSLRCQADFSDCFSLEEVAGFVDEQVLTEMAALGWEAAGVWRATPGEATLDGAFEQSLGRYPQTYRDLNK